MSPRIAATTVGALLVVFGVVLVAESTLGTGAELSAATTSPSATEAPALTSTTTAVPAPTTVPTTTSTTVPGLPAGSGSGHRVVFSVDQQRMWWVDGNEQVVRTALTSGRVDTPNTGTFDVYSKTENATGLDGSKMDYFVRFTKGPNGWAIGFHDIPEMGGVPVQTEDQLGTPLSHGCIRQAEADARFTWDWLGVGSTVVVVA